VNDPDFIDLDAACFMMFTKDLPALFGSMARPTNRKVPVRDLPEFDDWLHVISDPIVVGKAFKKECVGGFGMMCVMRVLDEYEPEEVTKLMTSAKCIRQVLEEFPDVMPEGVARRLAPEKTG
jgi:hypothetical protein